MPDGQLTTDERYTITHLHMAGHTPAEIGRRLGRHRANIGREIKRNADPMVGYHYASAQQQADSGDQMPHNAAFGISFVFTATITCLTTP